MQFLCVYVRMAAASFYFAGDL
ncbi:hypothetical protein A2U01_0091010 [Trifolium medium]|uniref:Uncharacterized protein n=1 Tax=Trifolium medium TaxID=97028 RepID=A0A392UA85_9FABA|nr:hypothetical protein [Trifolium medium]